MRGRRTDLIFVIYVYQRWVYRVDMKRVNEFGFGGDNEGKPAALAGVGDATKQNKGVRAPPNTSRLLTLPAWPAAKNHLYPVTGRRVVGRRMPKMMMVRRAAEAPRDIY